MIRIGADQLNCQFACQKWLQVKCGRSIKVWASVPLCLLLDEIRIKSQKYYYWKETHWVIILEKHNLHISAGRALASSLLDIFPKPSKIATTWHEPDWVMLAVIALAMQRYPRYFRMRSTKRTTHRRSTHRDDWGLRT